MCLYNLYIDNSLSITSLHAKKRRVYARKTERTRSRIAFGMICEENSVDI